MKKLLILCFLMILIQFASSQQKKLNIAVLKLESGGMLTTSEELALTNRLRSMLVRTNAFNVVERGRMEEILKEVGFQQTGCTSVECAVEVGRILNVQQMIAGNIGKLGSLYTIDINVIDVETAQIIRSFSKNYRGEIEGLIQYMEVIANEIAGMKSAQQATIPVKEKKEKSTVKRVKKSGSKKWLLLLGGAAAAGGAAAVIMSQQGGGTSTSNQMLPEPPARP
jgi:TolB-like protein